MSQCIYRGICRGGPLDGEDYTQVSLHPPSYGRFNYESLATGERGSYTFKEIGAWIWGEWIDAPVTQGTDA